MQLLIKPTKIEVLNLEPRVVKYINVITEEEIETVKKLASPQVTEGRKEGRKEGREGGREGGREERR